MESKKTMLKRAIRDLKKLLKERGARADVYHLETDKCIRCYAITDRDAALVPKRFMGFHIVTDFRLVGCTG